MILATHRTRCACTTSRDYLDDAFSEPARIVLCTNGSAERDGTRHRYGITVRKRFNDPVAAMADTYGVATEVYRQLETRR